MKRDLLSRARRKTRAIGRWCELAPHRGKMLRDIVETVLLDWESAVDQQEALRSMLHSFGCPKDLISIAEWAALEDKGDR